MINPPGFSPTRPAELNLSGDLGSDFANGPQPEALQPSWYNALEEGEQGNFDTLAHNVAVSAIDVLEAAAVRNTDSLQKLQSSYAQAMNNVKTFAHEHNLSMGEVQDFLVNLTERIQATPALTVDDLNELSPASVLSLNTAQMPRLSPDVEEALKAEQQALILRLKNEDSQYITNGASLTVTGLIEFSNPAVLKYLTPAAQQVVQTKLTEATEGRLRPRPEEVTSASAHQPHHTNAHEDDNQSRPEPSADHEAPADEEQRLTEGARIVRGMKESERVKLLAESYEEDAKALIAERYGVGNINDIMDDLTASYRSAPGYYDKAIRKLNRWRSLARVASFGIASRKRPTTQTPYEEPFEETPTEAGVEPSYAPSGGEDDDANDNTTDGGGWVDRLRGARDNLLGGTNLRIATGFQAVSQGLSKAAKVTSEKFTEVDPNDPDKRRMTLRGKALLLGIGVVGATVALVAGDSIRGGGHGHALADSGVDPSNPVPSAPEPKEPRVFGPTTPSAPEASAPSTPNTGTPFIPEPVEPQPGPGASAPNPSVDVDVAPGAPNSAPAPATETVTVNPGESVYEMGRSRGLTDTQIANGIKDGTIIGHNPDGSVINNLNNINPGDQITFGTEASPAPAAPNAPGPLDVHAPAPADAIHLSKGGNLSESVQDWLQHNGQSGGNIKNATQAVMDYNQSLGLDLNWESARQIQATNVGGTTVATLPNPHTHIPQMIHMPPPDVFERLMSEAAQKTTR